MAVLTLYNGNLLLSDGGGLQLSNSSAEPCCCEEACGQPYTSGLQDPSGNGWQPKNNAGGVTLRSTLPITYRFKIEQSTNCGGSNSGTQSGALSCFFVLTEPRRIRLYVSGYVERQDAGYDFGTLTVAGAQAQISSFGEGLQCAQAFNSSEAFIDLPAGRHNYEMSVDTRDGLYHENTEYTFEIQYA